MPQYTIDMPKAGHFVETLKFHSNFDNKDFSFSAEYQLVSGGKIKRTTPSIPDQIRNTMAGVDDDMLSDFEKKFNTKQVTALCGLLFCV